MFSRRYFTERFFPGVYFPPPTEDELEPPVSTGVGGGYFVGKYFCAGYFAKRYFPTPGDAEPAPSTGFNPAWANTNQVVGYFGDLE